MLAQDNRIHESRLASSGVADDENQVLILKFLKKLLISCKTTVEVSQMDILRSWYSVQFFVTMIFRPSSEFIFLLLEFRLLYDTFDILLRFCFNDFNIYKIRLLFFLFLLDLFFDNVLIWSTNRLLFVVCIKNRFYLTANRSVNTL